MGLTAGISYDELEEVKREYESELRDYEAEPATLRAENERLRNMLERAKILIPAHNWVWHEDVLEAMK